MPPPDDVTLGDETYVWVVWNFGGNRPEVKRYVLVETRDTGVKVKMRDTTDFIRVAQGRKFYYTREDAIAAYRLIVTWNARQMAGIVASLLNEIAKTDCGMVEDVVPPSWRHRKPKEEKREAAGSGDQQDPGP